jgi:hypothetical protein
MSTNTSAAATPPIIGASMDAVGGDDASIAIVVFTASSGDNTEVDDVHCPDDRVICALVVGNDRLVVIAVFTASSVVADVVLVDAVLTLIDVLRTVVVVSVIASIAGDVSNTADTADNADNATSVNCPKIIVFVRFA